MIPESYWRIWKVLVLHKISAPMWRNVFVLSLSFWSSASWNPSSRSWSQLRITRFSNGLSFDVSNKREKERMEGRARKKGKFSTLPRDSSASSAPFSYIRIHYSYEFSHSNFWEIPGFLKATELKERETVKGFWYTRASLPLNGIKSMLGKIARSLHLYLSFILSFPLSMLHGDVYLGE